MSIDPVIHSSESPYVAYFNNLIFFTDLFGNDPGIPMAEAGPNIPGINPVNPDEVILYQNQTWKWNNTRKIWVATYNHGMYDDY